MLKSKKIIYILDYFSYSETSNHIGQPERFLGFIVSLKLNDYAIVPKSLSRHLKLLNSFNNSIKANVIFIEDKITHSFYEEVKNTLSKIIRVDKEVSIITYSFSANIENILSQLNLMSFNNLLIAQGLNNKSNKILNSGLFPTLEKNKIVSTLEVGTLLRKYLGLNYKGIVIKKEIAEIGLGNLFVKNDSDIELILKEFDFNFDKENFFVDDIQIEPWLGDEYQHFNYQTLITRNKNNNIIFLGSSEQFFEGYENSNYKRIFFKGNFGPIPYNAEHYNVIMKVSKEIANTGYFGVVGIDLYSNGKNYGIMEFNCRFNSASSLYFYNMNINNILDNRFWLMADINFKGWSMENIQNYINDNDLIFNLKKGIGIFIFSISDSYFQLAIIGKTRDYVLDLYRKLENIN